MPDKSGDSHDHDTDESKGDYDDESELGPTLDFGAKLDGTDAGNELPIFLVEPQSTYVVRNRAAILKCKAAHALQVRYRHRHRHASNILLLSFSVLSNVLYVRESSENDEKIQWMWEWMHLSSIPSIISLLKCILSTVFIYK